MPRNYEMCSFLTQKSGKFSPKTPLFLYRKGPVGLQRSRFCRTTAASLECNRAAVATSGGPCDKTAAFLSRLEGLLDAQNCDFYLSEIFL